jgi:hypothetical protein
VQITDPPNETRTRNTSWPALADSPCTSHRSHLILIKYRRSIDQNRIHDPGLQARICDLWASVCAEETWSVGEKDMLVSVFSMCLQVV